MTKAKLVSECKKAVVQLCEGNRGGALETLLSIVEKCDKKEIIS